MSRCLAISLIVNGMLVGVIAGYIAASECTCFLCH